MKISKSNLNPTAAVLASLLALTSACSSQNKASTESSKPIATELRKIKTGEGESAQTLPAVAVQSLSENENATPAPVLKTDRIQVELTLEKSRILGREFMYSVDLQYSSQFDEAMNLYNQSLVVANVPVTFRIAGNELQLVSNNKIKFPSDNNHPEELITRFTILSQNETQLTVTGMNSAPYLAKQFAPADDTSKTVTYLDHWIRSFDFDPNGNYLLQQTSIKLGDGKSIGEFMESVYPRENIAAGADFKKFEMDPEDAVGASEGDVARYRFLPGDTIFQHDMNGEKKLAYSQHFDLSPKADGTPATIDWYVTPNIPDQYLAPVKMAVEGWNRYFNKMKGFERPVVRFMGRLPEGRYIGDPRYNVINWDSRLIAGAAYESQLSDPETGRQSHSLIYMPAAWVKIGSDYWRKGVGSDETVQDPIDGPTKPRLALASRVQCSRNLVQGAKLMASGRLADDEVKKFGNELLKQTLFHEVGHAMGLAHNFEGSLTFDRTNPNALFSSSIMDYNDYEIERHAFNDVDTDQGPLLEYDRQAISAIYNSSRDVQESDPTLPACNDAEADSDTAEGVNPLCIRYDVEKDPTMSIVQATHRVEDEKLAGDITLSQAMARLPDLILTDSKLQAARSEGDFLLLASQFNATLKGSLDFYLVSSEMSLIRTVRTNVKALLPYSALLDGYDEHAMRERVFAGITKVASLAGVPDAPSKATVAALQVGMQRLVQTPYFMGLSEADRNNKLTALSQAFIKSLQAFETSPTTGLTAARAKLFAALAKHKDSDFFVGKAGESVVDYERGLVNLLAEVVMNKARSGVERLAAAKALASYKGRLSGNSVLNTLKSGLLEERVTANSNEQRRTIEGVLAALGLNNS